MAQHHQRRGSRKERRRDGAGHAAAGTLRRRLLSACAFAALLAVTSPPKVSAQAVYRMSLGGSSREWRLRSANGSIDVPVAVPGVALAALLDAGVLQGGHPLYR